MKGLSAAELADLAGTTAAEVQQLVGLGILVARDGANPFLATDAQKIRLAKACEQAGLPMEGIAAAIRAGRLSFAFLEAAPFRRWAVRSGRTYRQVSQDIAMPLEVLGSALESMGFAPLVPDEPMREDELEIVPLLARGFASGLLDLAWLTRLGPGPRRGPAADRHRLGRGLPRPVRGAGVGLRRRPADRHGAGRRAGHRFPAAGRPRAAGHLPPPARAGMDRGPGRTHRGRARTGRGARATRAGPGDGVPGPGGLHPAHRGAGRCRRGRAGRAPGAAGLPVHARVRRHAGEVAG